MNTCRTCRHTTTKPGHEKMYRLGYRNCAHKHESHFVPGHMACYLTPVRWEPKQ